jgi:L-iditol 2-dehydrogenase
VLGHEFAGVVLSPDSELSGQRVAVDPAMPCNVCEFCLEENHNLCSDLHFAGHGLDDGALREYIAWPEGNLHLLPETISDEEGAMLEPLGVALHAVDLGQINPGSSVGVFGCGPIGLLVVQLARLAGAGEIIVTDRLPHRLQAAISMGATKSILVTDDWDLNEVWEVSAGRGVEVAFEVAVENLAVETAIGPGWHPSRESNLLYRLDCPAERSDDQTLPQDEVHLPARHSAG